MWQQYAESLGGSSSAGDRGKSPYQNPPGDLLSVKTDLGPRSVRDRTEALALSPRMMNMDDIDKADLEKLHRYAQRTMGGIYRGYGGGRSVLDASYSSSGEGQVP